MRAEIEAAGWKVIDRGVDFALEPAHAADVVEDGRVRYGSSGAVPSRLDEPATGAATVVIRATDWPDDVARAVAGLRRWSPEGTSIVVVADAPNDEQAHALESLEADGSAEVVWTSARLGHAAALNAGIRRASGPIVVLFDTSVEPLGDVISPLVSALADEAVAVAGGFGLRSTDLRHFEEASGDVAAIEGYVLAFRRVDVAERGPLDEHFRFYRNLDIWWSLVLRDAGDGVEPRRAVAIAVSVERHEHRGWTEVAEGERDRLSKRNFYRIIDRFGKRLDLAKS